MADFDELARKKRRVDNLTDILGDTAEHIKRYDEMFAHTGAQPPEGKSEPDGPGELPAPQPPAPPSRGLKKAAAAERVQLYLQRETIVATKIAAIHDNSSPSAITELALRAYLNLPET